MKKILFFVRGFAPAPSDMKQAGKLDGEILFRNVELFDETQPLEDCDGVAGAAPQTYVEKYGVASVEAKEAKPAKVEEVSETKKV